MSARASAVHFLATCACPTFTCVTRSSPTARFEHKLFFTANLSFPCGVLLCRHRGIKVKRGKIRKPRV